MYFDTHVHFDGLGGVTDAGAAVERADEAGVTGMIAVGGDGARNEFALGMAERFGGLVHAAVGYDRDRANHLKDRTAVEQAIGDLRNYIAGSTCRGNGPVAIGEIGLDYHYSADTSDAH